MIKKVISKPSNQPLICQNASSVPEEPWLPQLKMEGVKIQSISSGKLFTGKQYEFECGLVSMLGWTADYCEYLFLNCRLLDVIKRTELVEKFE